MVCLAELHACQRRLLHFFGNVSYLCCYVQSGICGVVVIFFPSPGFRTVKLVFRNTSAM